MIICAVPAKDLVNAKQRLVPALGPRERHDLARAMLSDVLAALRAARLDGVWVVTRDPEVIELAVAGGAAVSGPAGALMRARDLSVSAVGVAAAYAPWLGTLVIDRSDTGRVVELARLGVKTVLADIVMTDSDREIALARVVLGQRR